MQIALLVRSTPTTSADQLSGADYRARLAAALDTGAAPASGLVVSEVFRPLGDLDDVVCYVAAWFADDLDAAALGAKLDACAGLGGAIEAWRVREHVLKAPVEREGAAVPEGTVTLLGTAYRREDFSTEAFFAYWREVHAPISASVPGVGGYVVAELTETLAGGLHPDAFIEQWYPSEAAFDASGESPESARAWEDVANYAQTTGVFWLLRDHVVLPPAPTGPGLLEVGRA